MTVAVCIRCGAKKHGALTPCHGCTFDPTTNIDKAQSMVLTDHFLPNSELDAIGERIRMGRPVTYPENVVADYVALFERGADKPPMPVRAGCVVALLVVVALVALLVLWGV